MKTISLFTLAAALGMGTASLLRIDHQFPSAVPNSVLQATDGAFRDGVYLGKLAAKRGLPSHVAIGRWSTPVDRTSFAAGYQQGYSEFLANRAASVSGESRTD